MSENPIRIFLIQLSSFIQANGFCLQPNLFMEKCFASDMMVYLGRQWPGHTQWPDWSCFCLFVGRNKEVSCHAGWEGHPNNSWASANPPEGIRTAFKLAKQMCYEINQDPGLLGATASGFRLETNFSPSWAPGASLQQIIRTILSGCLSYGGRVWYRSRIPLCSTCREKEWETKRKGDLAAGIGVARRRH